MRKFPFLFLLLLPASAILAQVSYSKDSVRRKKCYTAEYLEKIQKANPGTESTAEFENWMSAKILQKRSTPALNAIINYGPLPIIFHVIHSGQAEGSSYNISQALVQAQLRQLNKDYANLSGSNYSVSSPTGIQFCLAAKDPGGNTLAQPGIDRVNSVGKTYGTPPYTETNFDSKVKAATIWDPKKYINVWVTVFTDDEGILGYATFPASSTLSGLDNSETNLLAGVVIDYTTVGSVGTPSSACSSSNPYNTGRTLTHELGHFFGLRHIWGDSNCGNDYCGDTPKHTDANYGLPVHPKPNSCGTPDEMFENFMDYTDDKALNTFTLNQAERMQVVMVNSTRRKELTSSTAGCGSASGASKIGFTPCEGKMVLSEKSSMATCPAYTDVKLYLNIEDQATGAATLTVNTGGTATKNIDYEILNPTLNISAGESFKMLTVRIFDDVAKEADETIVLSYSIAGAGVSASSSLPQSFIITILDDDNLTISQNVKTIYSEDFGTSGNTLPTGWTLMNGDIASPKNKWVVSSNPGAGTTGQSLHISNNSATKAYTYTLGSASAHIAQSPLINAGNLGTLNLSFKYKVAGEIDADGTYDFGTVETSLQSDPTTLVRVPGTNDLVGTYDAVNSVTKVVTSSVNRVLPSSLRGQKFYLNFYWENDDNSGDQPPLAIDDILITARGTGVESQLNHAKTVNILAADSNFIVSQDDGEILATISKSTLPINCLNALVQQTGTGQADLTTSTGNFKRSQKVIKLAPQAGGSNATYSLTLYFTTAELETWPGIFDLKVMKVPDGVSLSGVVNSGNISVFSPVVDDRRTTEGYAAFTITTTGFSQFFLASANAILPLQLVTFNVAAVNNGAMLNWNTSNEFSNKGFTIERSTDGANFTPVGFVGGKNQSATAASNSYSYFDSEVQQGFTYYYRLQVLDLNGRGTYSEVRSTRLLAGSPSIVVYPNPTKNNVHVVTGKIMNAGVSLSTMNGKTVWSRPKQNINGGFDVPMKNLPAGVYLVIISGETERQQIKIIKE